MALYTDESDDLVSWSEKSRTPMAADVVVPSRGVLSHGFEQQ